MALVKSKEGTGKGLRNRQNIHVVLQKKIMSLYSSFFTKKLNDTDLILLSGETACRAIPSSVLRGMVGICK